MGRKGGIVWGILGIIDIVLAIGYDLNGEPMWALMWLLIGVVSFAQAIYKYNHE